MEILNFSTLKKMFKAMIWQSQKFAIQTFLRRDQSILIIDV